MNKDVNEFLESGVLEEYLMGICDEEKSKVVEYYIETFPEVKAEYEKLQEIIEESAKDLAIEPPSGMKEAIISCLNEKDDYKVKTALTKKRRSLFPYYGWAAAVIGLFLSSVLFLNNKGLKNHNMELHASMNMMETQLDRQESEIAQLEERLMISGHNKTARVMLAGNQLSPSFQTTAFWNDVAKKAILYINDLGPLEKGKCYQIWADVEGEMINLGVLPNKTGLLELEYLENASSLNITIEPDGGSDHPTVSNIISSKNLISL